MGNKINRINDVFRVSTDEVETEFITKINYLLC